ncbi:MAG: DUF86 domain-containing protein [Armatimonadetes bacterium]|nr:DUF86 domain-containing protein [Armatimonadota bacterium]
MSDTAKDDRLYLTHIRECLARIAQYTQGGHDEFPADTKTQDAVLRNLQTMAESTQRLSESSKAAHPQVDWRGIAAFRNVLAHGYLSINLERVWQTFATDLPPFEQGGCHAPRASRRQSVGHRAAAGEQSSDVEHGGRAVRRGHCSFEGGGYADGGTTRTVFEGRPHRHPGRVLARGRDRVGAGGVRPHGVRPGEPGDLGEGVRAH